MNFEPVNDMIITARFKIMTGNLTIKSSPCTFNGSGGGRNITLRWDKDDVTSNYVMTGMLSDKIKHKWLFLKSAHSCCVTDHCVNIDILYSEIIHCLDSAAKCCIPVIPKSALKHYWSSYLDELNKFSDFLGSSHLQFGFEKGSGCPAVVFTMQQVIQFYLKCGSNVFATALDASKAFDCVTHTKLFDKQVVRGVQLCFLNVIRSWYEKLVSVVRWDCVFSNEFRVYYAVFGGRILSTLLFNIYVDVLINILESSGHGVSNFLTVFFIPTTFC